jgi:hypothetical protein
VLLYLARIEDLGRSDFVKVDCAACHHVALLTPEFLLRLGLSPQGQGARRNGTRPVPGMRNKGTSRRVGQVAAPERVSLALAPTSRHLVRGSEG